MNSTTMLVVSHTHWDREWYHSFQQFRARLVEMMDALLALLGREPRFTSSIDIRPHSAYNLW
ncbi:MAG: hypothetical protein SXV54_17930 [Chloroflexota bacterium]|nr:hypothetical protein [Chloroflexota bacterium]